MNLEIQFGNETYYQAHCGNKHEGCINVLKEVAEQGDIPMSDFEVYDINNYENETIGLAEILSIKYLSNNYDLTSAESVV